MRKLVLAGITAVLLAAPLQQAKAGFLLEGSLGSGVQTKPSIQRIPTNVMVTPGYSLLGMLALQLGIVADLPDVEAGEFDLQLRPMLKIDPPVLPVYGRIILAATNLLGDGDPVMAYGGTLGVGFSLAGLGAFAELGVLPRSVNDEMQTLVEARIGLSLGL